MRFASPLLRALALLRRLDFQDAAAGTKAIRRGPAVTGGATQILDAGGLTGVARRVGLKTVQSLSILFAGNYTAMGAEDTSRAGNQPDTLLSHDRWSGPVRAARHTEGVAMKDPLTG
jgi:hypothetical protein